MGNWFVEIDAMIDGSLEIVRRYYNRKVGRARVIQDVERDHPGAMVLNVSTWYSTRRG